MLKGQETIYLESKGGNTYVLFEVDHNKGVVVYNYGSLNLPPNFNKVYTLDEKGNLINPDGDLFENFKLFLENLEYGGYLPAELPTIYSTAYLTQSEKDREEILDWFNN